MVLLLQALLIEASSNNVRARAHTPLLSARPRSAHLSKET